MTDPKTIAVLGYHKIGAPPKGTWATWNYVAADRFRDHLRIIASGGWDVLDTPRFLAGLDDPARLGPRSVLLTFDDACTSLRDAAVPELARAALPSVVFVPTGFVGKTNTFDNGAEPEEAIMDWDDLAAVRAAGMDVQSHGVTHRTFSSLTPDDRAHELEASKATLEARLGAEVRLFAFPFGDDGDDENDGGATATLAARAGYRAAFRYGGGAVHVPDAAPFRLPRIPVGADTDLERKLAMAEGARR